MIRAFPCLALWWRYENAAWFTLLGSWCSYGAGELTYRSQEKDTLE